MVEKQERKPNERQGIRILKKVINCPKKTVGLDAMGRRPLRHRILKRGTSGPRSLIVSPVYARSIYPWKKRGTAGKNLTICRKQKK